MTVRIGLGPIGAAVVVGFGRVGREELGITTAENNRDDNGENGKEDASTDGRA